MLGNMRQIVKSQLNNLYEIITRVEENTDLLSIYKEDKIKGFKGAISYWRKGRRLPSLGNFENKLDEILEFLGDIKNNSDINDKCLKLIEESIEEVRSMKVLIALSV